MIDCAYCQNPLVCDACQAEYLPPDLDTYRALSWTETVLKCSSCGEVLVCHWCKTPYEGNAEPGDEVQGN